MTRCLPNGPVLCQAVLIAFASREGFTKGASLIYNRDNIQRAFIYP